MTKKLLQNFLFAFNVPLHFDGARKIIARNFLAARGHVSDLFLVMVIEPVLYLLALGEGLGWLIGKIHGQDYYSFIFPGLIAIWCAAVAFHSSTMDSYSRLSGQPGLDVFRWTPIKFSEIFLAEIIWATLKGWTASFVLLVIAFGQGYLKIGNIGLALLVTLILSWCFAALGALVFSFAKEPRNLTFAFGLIVLPMILFCGTLFPTSAINDWYRDFFLLLPMTHGTMALRALFTKHVDATTAINLAIILLMALAFTNIAISRLTKKFESSNWDF